MQAIAVMTTTATKEQAQEIARVLIESHLAACVQILGPMESTYFWQDKMEKAEEWLCLIKTGLEMWEAVAACLRQKHPYQVPEIISVNIDGGDTQYLRWLTAQVGQAPQ